MGEGRLLRRAIQADMLSSLIFAGPPGTGKTTLAMVIANTTRSRFASLNAVLSGVKEVRAEIEIAREQMALHGRRTILFVDEVHRWNKAQQDALLPWVENGTVILIGATTENPFFEVNAALVSRSRIFQLRPLSTGELRRVAQQALGDPLRGYGSFRVRLADDALDHLVSVADGDARSLLNALQLAVETSGETFPPPAGTEIEITLEVAAESIQRKALLYDREGDYHYDSISAFIKSLRGSDPDAALYWMARMIAAGEDPRYVLRRMLISASEDVGLADPNALVVVEAAARAFDRVGLPEGQFHLAHAALYLATCPKSNTTLAYFDARSAVEMERSREVPRHLRDANRDKEGFGHGEGYLYPHAYRDHWVAQAYLPQALQGRLFYSPSRQGYEATIADEVERRRELQLSVAAEDEDEQEVLTFSPPDSGRDRWLQRLSHGRSAQLNELRERVFAAAALRRHESVLVLGSATDILVWEALRLVPEGLVGALVSEPLRRDRIAFHAERLEALRRPVVCVPDATGLRPEASDPEKRCEGVEHWPARFDAVIGRNLLQRLPDKATRVQQLAGICGGRIVLAESVAAEGSRLAQLFGGSIPSAELGLLAAAEEAVYRNPQNPMVNWRPEDLERAFHDAGLHQIGWERAATTARRAFSDADLHRWLFEHDGPLAVELAARAEAAAIQRLERALRSAMPADGMEWKSVAVVIWGSCSNGPTRGVRLPPATARGKPTA